jgi:hypothetical protein
MMNALQDSTLSSGLTFRTSGLTCLKRPGRYGRDLLLDNLSNNIELALNVLESDDPMVPLLIYTMKELRR